jgi:hypothetical protein
VAAGGDGAFEVVPILIEGDFLEEFGAVFKAHSVEEFVCPPTHKATAD